MTGLEAQALASGINTGVSLAKTLSGIIKQNKSTKMDIPEVDPEETQALSEIKNRSRALRMGSAYGRTIREIKSGSKVGSSRVFSSGFALRSMINKIQANENSALVALNQAAENSLYQNLALENQLRTRISQRKLEVGLLKQSKLEATGASSKKVGMENVLGIINNLDPAKKIGGKNSVLSGFMKNIQKTDKGIDMGTEIQDEPNYG